MPYCGRCGRKLGFLERRGEPLCKTCRAETRAERDEARRRYGEVVEALAAGSMTPKQALPVLKETTPLAGYQPADVARVHGQALQTYFDRVLADDILTVEEEKEFEAITDALGLSSEDVATLDRSIINRFFIAQVNGGRMVELPPEHTSLIRKKDEAVYLETPAALMKEVTKRQYVGGYGGVSFRIAKGVRFHTGGFRGRPVVVGTELQVDDTGLLAITSLRAVFMGERKTVEMPYTKLVSLNVFSDGIQFHVSHRQKAPLFRVQSGELAAAYVNAAVQRLE